MKNLNNTAFSLLEILLSAIIFVVTVAGIFATLSAVRAPVASEESSLAAAVFGKQVLEDLRSTVSTQSSANFYEICPGGNCTDFSLALGNHVVASGNLPQGLTLPSGSSTLNYTVCCATGCPVGGSYTCPADDARMVTNINW